MPDELFCQKHGPYDAYYGTCPYCSGAFKRPPEPKPLSEDDLPTDLGAGNRSVLGDEDTPTDLDFRHRVNAREYSDEDAPTEIGPSRRARQKFLDSDIEETIIGKVSRGVGETEIYDEDIPIGMMGILWMKEGLRRGKIYPLLDGAVVGRDQGDLILHDLKVSNPHARFVVENNQFVLWDFGSKNGTFVNGERIRAATILKENDIIKMGTSTFVLKILEEEKGV